MVITAKPATDGLSRKKPAPKVSGKSYSLPEKGFVRIWQIVGNPKTKPPIPGIIPVSRTTWLNGCKSGKYPRPIKLGERTTAWRVSDIKALLESLESAA
ncbi:MAG: AlpA family phage regulatory protein [Methylovulum sp.]|nr:AlpA family phage regulatory protein [Methylovulum sp.]